MNGADALSEHRAGRHHKKMLRTTLALLRRPSPGWILWTRVLAKEAAVSGLPVNERAAAYRELR